MPLHPYRHLLRPPRDLNPPDVGLHHQIEGIFNVESLHHLPRISLLHQLDLLKEAAVQVVVQRRCLFSVTPSHSSLSSN